MSEIVKKQHGGARPGAGRPHKIVEQAQTSILLELFDEKAEREVVEAMIARAKWSASDSASVSAATWLWDRKYGKLTEKSESRINIDVTQLSDEELDRIINARGG